MLKKRLIARLDIKGDNLIKPINLEGLRVVGNPKEYAEYYDAEGIDELLFMDAVASLYGRNNLCSLLDSVSQNVFTPITAGGGIRSLGDARMLLRFGADKVAINTAAVRNPDLITQVANACGSQCMVLQIDAKARDGWWEAYIDGGREPTGRNVTHWAIEGVKRGAGEILLTSIDREGTRRGYDTGLIAALTNAVNVPVIASGGMGDISHMIGAFTAGADAVAMADILHYRRESMETIRKGALQNNIPVREYGGRYANPSYA